MSEYTNTFLEELQRIKAKIYDLDRYDLEADKDSIIPMDYAVEHAAMLRIAQDKLCSGMPIYLACYKDRRHDTVMLIMNDKPVADSNDGACIWRATDAETNSEQCAKSVMRFAACMLTILGIEIHVTEQSGTVLFNPIISGKGEYVVHAVGENDSKEHTDA